jgi:hypothetical protein
MTIVTTSEKSLSPENLKLSKVFKQAYPLETRYTIRFNLIYISAGTTPIITEIPEKLSGTMSEDALFL